MVLVDTSIWVEHLRKGNRRLAQLLLDAQVVCHPFVIGELACGDIKNRSEILALLRTLPIVQTVQLDEILYFVERSRLHGIGIGFVDVHLLASTKISGVPLWTSDKKLREAASSLDLVYK